MSPYDVWKTTDLDGERAAAAGDWIDARAYELIRERWFLKDTAENTILDSGYEANAPAIVELVADIIELHRVDADDLPGSDLIARLYRHARTLHQQAEIAALASAQDERDSLPPAA